MGNKLALLVLFLFSSYCLIGQDKEFKERYIELSQFESKEYLNGRFESGKYYLTRRENNQVKEIQIRNYKDGKQDGEWLTFSKTFGGVKLRMVCNYQDGKKHGYFFTTDNHTITEEGYYKFGKRHGKWKFIEALGGYTTELKGEYINGKKHGRWAKIDFEFEEKEVIIYKKGKKHGKYLLENKKYKTTVIGAYKSNLKHGLWITKDEGFPVINEDGTTTPSIKKEHYKNGKLIKTE